jgi:hypothetical protein
LATYPALTRVLATLGDDIEIAPPSGPVPQVDLTCPLLSVPHKLGVTLETIPRAPYLSAPTDIAHAWSARLQVDRGLRVGLAWSGNTQYVNDATRSLRLEQLRTILDVPHVRFVSVQRDVRPAEEDLLRALPIADYRTLLTDFAETAGLIATLDLVISVDTSIAHLAGALGKPVWVLLSAVSDWRWLECRSDSPWYPTARLFRQRAIGEWDAVLAEVRAALGELAARRALGQ